MWILLAIGGWIVVLTYVFFLCAAAHRREQSLSFRRVSGDGEGIRRRR